MNKNLKLIPKILLIMIIKEDNQIKMQKMIGELQ